LKGCIVGQKHKNDTSGSNFRSGIWSGLNPGKGGLKGLDGLKNGGIRHIYQALTFVLLSPTNLGKVKVQPTEDLRLKSVKEAGPFMTLPHLFFPLSTNCPVSILNAYTPYHGDRAGKK